jgi:hippurate hydrolase
MVSCRPLTPRKTEKIPKEEYYMPINSQITEFADEITDWRRDLHANPELMYEVHRTADSVANKLKSFGVDEVVTGIGRTGVVGVIRGRETRSGRTVGLRADMDALPIEETTGLPYASTREGVMHACGHDGHTAMLLGAAKYLAQSRNFDGMVVLIFQPAEEGGAGGKAMIDDGLMERFGIQEVYGLHNKPGIPVGHFSICPGPMLAATDRFTIDISGRGGHAAYPHTAVDATLVAGQIMVMLQTIVARNVDPIDSAVVSVTTVRAGQAFNVIPETARLTGTVRTLKASTQDLMETRIAETAELTARALGATAKLDYVRNYPMLVNDSEKTRFAAEIARGVAGEAAVEGNGAPTLGGEDFAFMLEARPGAFIFAGIGEDRPALHQPRYDFNDALIPAGCSYWAHLVETALPITQ